MALRGALVALLGEATSATPARRALGEGTRGGPLGSPPPLCPPPLSHPRELWAASSNALPHSTVLAVRSGSCGSNHQGRCSQRSVGSLRGSVLAAFCSDGSDPPCYGQGSLLWVANLQSARLPAAAGRPLAGAFLAWPVCLWCCLVA